tara:strand:+ start:115 stop:732 length:618 start_codon:yes stop_codon:yes gene_type:complete
MKKKFTFRETVFFSPWAMLSVFILGIALMNVVAFADHEDDNYERQKANIDMANDGIVGYTHDGLPVYESEIEDQLSIDRELNIVIKGKQQVDVNILNANTLELTINEKIYTMIVNCKLNDIDTIQWFTWPIDNSQLEGDGSLDVGDFGIARRDPFKYFDNPKIRESLTKDQVESKLKDWNLDQRVCEIQAIQIINLPAALEDIRG